MYLYYACGLDIQSDLILPELGQPKPSNVMSQNQLGAVRFKLSKIDLPESDFLPQNGFYIHNTPESTFFFWERIGAFLVRGGEEILIDPLPEIEERLVRLPLLGVVLATLLHRRSLFVLHASAVSVNGRAVAFLGDKGAGKSTTAMAFCRQGYKPITDDVLAISIDANGILAWPSFAQFKLWPDTVTALGHNPDELPILMPEVAKRSYHNEEEFSLAPVPLQRMYILSISESLEITPVSSQESLLYLITNTYSTRFGSQLLQGAAGPEHLRQCTTLINKIPVKWLKKPRALETLPDIVKLVEEDLAQDIS